MAGTHQLLLDTPKKSPTFSCKALLVFLCSAAIICPSAFVAFHLINNSSNPNLSLPSQICNRVHGPASCLQIFLNNSVSHIAEVIDAANHISRRINDAHEQAPLADCVELMELSIKRVNDSVVAIGHGSTESSLADAHAWLSSVLTNHETCLDGLKGGRAQSAMEAQIQNLKARARTSLAMFTAILPSDEEAFRPLHGRFPSWVTSRDRKLLESLPKDIKLNANVVVASDGSGKYKTVTEAVASAPNNGNSRYVIYVKKGTYKENVQVGQQKKNVMIVGDGMDSTIITGSLNVVDGATTFNSATVAAADGFMAQDIWIQNTAGPQKNQAVALRVSADRSVINRCRIDAYQDTLYAHTLRQFYRDSYITGTVDFIFGDAAVVFQNCKLVARKPMSGQQNMVTAQGRLDPNQNTGTSIQNCQIIASSDLAPVKSSFPSYLGRPWKEYSRTVVMQSYIGDHIAPQGWALWSGDFALKTLYYGEYSNSGPGAGTSKRVNWAGYHIITNAAEASKFTVSSLIQGGAWLKSTGVTYTEGL
ncbi:pectinesterase-like [Telopea speciosissima]|uniref:pectinesterase-like n=1 Tax=Telopea speciosissima TaxID=54955 RepID=UPI001CC41319|nr:pectinesterase-like [Telopea speciosissima]